MQRCKASAVLCKIYGSLKTDCLVNSVSSEPKRSSLCKYFLVLRKADGVGYQCGCGPEGTPAVCPDGSYVCQSESQSVSLYS